MLELKVSGDTHPKTFTLITDDGDAELVVLDGHLEETPLEEWMRAHDADEFSEGVEVPTEHILVLRDALEGCAMDEGSDAWEEAAEVITATISRPEAA